MQPQSPFLQSRLCDFHFFFFLASLESREKNRRVTCSLHLSGFCSTFGLLILRWLGSRSGRRCITARYIRAEKLLWEDGKGQEWQLGKRNKLAMTIFGTSITRIGKCNYICSKVFYTKRQAFPNLDILQVLYIFIAVPIASVEEELVVGLYLALSGSGTVNAKEMSLS